MMEYTVRHPTGVVDDTSTATRFGPTTDLQEAQRRLEIARSDCLCTWDEPQDQHVLVARELLPYPPWVEVAP